MIAISDKYYWLQRSFYSDTILHGTIEKQWLLINITATGILKNQDLVPEDEENFDEAIRNVNSTLVPTKVIIIHSLLCQVLLQWRQYDRDYILIRFNDLLLLWQWIIKHDYMLLNVVVFL